MYPHCILCYPLKKCPLLCVHFHFNYCPLKITHDEHTHLHMYPTVYQQHPHGLRVWHNASHPTARHAQKTLDAGIQTYFSLNFDESIFRYLNQSYKPRAFFFYPDYKPKSSSPFGTGWDTVLLSCVRGGPLTHTVDSCYMYVELWGLLDLSNCTLQPSIMKKCM